MAERDRATRPRLGDRTACRNCGMDIEYHGGQHGWIGRGGDTHCDRSGAAYPKDQYGGYGPTTYPHIKHKPVSDRATTGKVAMPPPIEMPSHTLNPKQFSGR